jgi:hypothetical protein
MADNDRDVAQILRQLKREVREQYLEKQQEVPLSRAAALEEVHATSWVNPHQPIAWPRWPKGVWPTVVAFVQKVVRRLLRWYINPIVEEQNRFNQAVAEALEALAQENARLRAELHVHVSDHPGRSHGRKTSSQADTRAGENRQASP